MTEPLHRIALCCGSLVRAGLERVVCDLARGMKSNGVDVSVISYLGGELTEEIRAAGIEVDLLFGVEADQYRPSTVGSLAAVLRMARILRRRRIQALNVHGLGAHRIALMASRLARTPLRTFVFHDNYRQLYDGDPRVAARIRREFNGFEHHISITRKIADLATRAGMVAADRISVINNGIRVDTKATGRSRDEVRAELGFDADARLAILVARFDPKKNHAVAVAAMQHVVAEDPRIHLVLVGIGQEEGRARAICDELDLAGNVHFLGLRADIADLLGASDLFVLPSDFEGLPIAMLEGMLAGLPTVASDAPGISDTVDLDPGCARLIPPRDERALADAIVAAFADSAWLEDAGTRGERLVREHHDARIMIERYIELHRELWQDLA